MANLLCFEDISVGNRWVSPTRVITQNDVENFADLTGDRNPLHMDADFASESPFGRPIAHGLLGLSFVAGLGSKSPEVHTEAFLGVADWKFLRPVYFGDTVHVVTEAINAEPYGRKRGRVLWHRALVNQNEQVVQEGKFETLVTRRQPKDRDESKGLEPVSSTPS